MRGSYVFVAWNAGSGGKPASYTLVAAFSPGGPAIAVIGTAAPYLNVASVPNGTYYVRVYANTACGTSAPSNEIVVVAPSNSPALTPPSATGRLPWPYARDLAFQFAQEAIGQGLIGGLVSCPQRSGYPWQNSPDPSQNDPAIIELQKTQPNPYINYIVSRLRLIDQRFGYNAKPTRHNAIIAGDEVAYHWGSDAAEGSPNVYLIDVLSGHCTFGREGPDYRTFTDEYGKWTSAGRF
jgi:hypothetical protein